MNATRKVCSVDECESFRHAHGLCGMHAQRRRRGEPIPVYVETELEKFLDRTDRDGPVSQLRPELGACWIWSGAAIKSGYGRFGRSNEMAHRFSYRSMVAAIPPGHHVDHLCMVKMCVNPKHLEAVTPAENLLRADRFYGIRSAAVACPKGHPYAGANLLEHSGRRHCRECQLSDKRRRRAALRIARQPVRTIP